jgi:hypothetical protein
LCCAIPETEIGDQEKHLRKFVRKEDSKTRPS